jgi:hypothetical protein
MIKIQYPHYDYKIRQENGKEFIFDELRRTWVRLTPEEWVRQNFLQYLVKVKAYPMSMIALEKEIQLGELKKRFDLLVYDSAHHPWMMVECKSTDVPLNEQVLDQLLRYNISIPVPFLVITNGTYVAGFERKATGMEMIDALPSRP